MTTPNLVSMVESAARANPDGRAIVHGSSSMTFREMSRVIDAVARNAVADGAKPGDRFLYAAKPSPSSLAITLGLLRAGLTLVFVDPFSSVELFSSRARLVSPTYVVADSLLYALGNRWLAPLRRLARFHLCDYTTVPNVTHLVVGNRLPGVPRSAINLASWATPPAVQTDLPPMDADADAIVTFTSGTTGDPKGVVHSLGTLSANAHNVAKLFDIHENSVVYSEPMTLGIVALAMGATWHIPHAKTPLPPAIDLYFSIPTDLLTFLDRVRTSPNPPRVRSIGVGAAPVLPSLIRETIAVLPDVNLVNVYGMTEMLPVATCDARDKIVHLDNGHRGDLLGRPIGDTQIRIAEDGEILVSGSGLMKRYFGKPENRWHPTGDVGTVTADGNIVLLGRKKNMLIRANKNIYPSLYEPGITTIEGVADAAIVGTPDEIGDDRVTLFIVPTQGANHGQVLARVKRVIAEYIDADAIPDRIAILERIPTSGRANKRDTPALAVIAAEAFRANGST